MQRINRDVCLQLPRIFFRASYSVDPRCFWHLCMLRLVDHVNVLETQYVIFDSTPEEALPSRCVNTEG